AGDLVRADGDGAAQGPGAIAVREGDRIVAGLLDAPRTVERTAERRALTAGVQHDVVAEEVLAVGEGNADRVRGELRRRCDDGERGEELAARRVHAHVAIGDDETVRAHAVDGEERIALDVVARLRVDGGGNREKQQKSHRDPPGNSHRAWGSIVAKARQKQGACPRLRSSIGCRMASSPRSVAASCRHATPNDAALRDRRPDGRPDYDRGDSAGATVALPMGRRTRLAGERGGSIRFAGWGGWCGSPTRAATGGTTPRRSPARCTVTRSTT